MRLTPFLKRFPGKLMVARAAGTLICLNAIACAPFPEPVELQQLAVAKQPPVHSDPETGRRYVDIDVLIYNIRGLPWPVPASGRAAMAEIGRILGEMRAAGTEPDIVLLQEAFTMKSQPIVELGGYPNVVGGPATGDSSERVRRDEAPEFIDARSFWKGEKLGKWVNGGLAILSNYPITESVNRPFRRNACAGFDCMSNKGMLLAAIHIPGVPEPIEVFNTHMNSNDASGVSAERSLFAHNLQSDEIDDFLLDEINDDNRAVIVGGDFNTRGDRERLLYLANGNISPIVRVHCTQDQHECDIRMSFDGDEPWLDTQDLQAFFSGRRVFVTPIAIDALFDEPVNGKMLSDHDGYLVRYRLSWDPDSAGSDTTSKTQAQNG